MSERATTIPKTEASREKLLAITKLVQPFIRTEAQAVELAEAISAFAEQAIVDTLADLGPRWTHKDGEADHEVVPRYHYNGIPAIWTCLKCEGKVLLDGKAPSVTSTR